jgi:hypothetical protein
MWRLPSISPAPYPLGFLGGTALHVHCFFPHFEHRIHFADILETSVPLFSVWPGRSCATLRHPAASALGAALTQLTLRDLGRSALAPLISLRAQPRYCVQSLLAI